VWINKSSLVVEIEIDTGEKTNKHRQKNSSDLTLYNKNFPLHIRKKKKQTEMGATSVTLMGQTRDHLFLHCSIGREFAPFFVIVWTAIYA
jgi:hypothetical protein